MPTIETSEIRPGKIKSGYLFNIPIYQRLYSWEEKEIHQLLADLYSSFIKDESKPYYLGNLVLYKNADKRFDIIDGQQRITTLFLMGLVFKKDCKEWVNFLNTDNGLRLAFIAREGDNAFLKSNLDGGSLDGENINNMMVKSLDVIRAFCDEDQEVKNNRENFAKYIYEQATMIAIEIPEGIDLNKYFEDMNNRGIQLEKHEILKAKLLEKIKVDEQELNYYARLWDACSQMNQFVEYGFKPEIDLKLSRSHIIYINKEFTFENISNLINKPLRKNITLSDILNESESESESEATKKNNPEEDQNDKVSSIINFPSFILYCYKLFENNKKDTKLTDRDLLDVFDEKLLNSFDAERTKRFINHLFRRRILYDSFFIKSIAKDGNSHWEIRKIIKSEKGEYSRDKADLKESTVIQAMLNSSTGLENWFAPALNYAIANEKQLTDESFCQFLENLDTELAKERINGKSNLKKVTEFFTDNFEKLSSTQNKDSDYQAWLKTILHQGTKTPRYWFFRLDYYLRKKFIIDNAFFKKDKDKVENFQFRQNRSVEHIQPQSKTWEEEEGKKLMDNFGNLALISVSSNSSLNDKEFEHKKKAFETKTANYGIESLKLAKAFEEPKWNPTTAENHGKEMIDILVESFKIDSISKPVITIE